MTRDEARDFLDRLSRRGIVVRLDAGALDVSGPASETDRAQLAAYAGPVAGALRHAEAPTQPETAPPAPAAPTPPEPSSVLARYEAEQRAKSRTYRGRPITRAELEACLRSAGDLDAFHDGTISLDEAYERTRVWLRTNQQLNDAFPLY